MLECTGVTVGAVLRDVALSVRAGEVVALTAPSGAGKSTLLRACVRLVEFDGAIALDGVDVRTLDPRALRRRVGLVAQRPVMLPGTVAENLAYGVVDPDAHAALEAAGLDESFADRDASRLSGGEQARVAIARALTRRPCPTCCCSTSRRRGWTRRWPRRSASTSGSSRPAVWRSA